MEKLYTICLLFFSLILVGCGNNTEYKNNLNQSVDTGYISPKVDTQLTGEIILGKTILDGIHKIIISGNKISYDNIFNIEIPKDLNIWKYGKNKRLDFIADSSQKYMHIDSYDIPDWKSNKSDKEKCTLGNYESHILSINTNSKVMNGQTIYVTKAVRSTDHERNDLDLCFIRNNIIYLISISAYEIKEAENIIDSFQFIN